MPTKPTLKEKKKNPAAVALGKLGGAKGGKARAANLSPEERSRSAAYAAKARARKLSAEDRRKIARKASLARWKSNEEATA